MSILGKIKLPNNLPQDTSIDTRCVRYLSTYPTNFRETDNDIVPCGDHIFTGDLLLDRVKFIEYYRWPNKNIKFIERYAHIEDKYIYPYAIRIHGKEGTEVVLMLEQLNHIKEALDGEYTTHESLVKVMINNMLDNMREPEDIDNEVLSVLEGCLKQNNELLSKVSNTYSSESVLCVLDEAINTITNPYLKSSALDPLVALIKPSIIDHLKLDQLTVRTVDDPVRETTLKWRYTKDNLVDLTTDKLSTDKGLIVHAQADNSAITKLSSLVNHLLTSPLTDVDVTVGGDKCTINYSYSRWFPESSSVYTGRLVRFLLAEPMCINPLDSKYYSSVRVVKTFKDEVFVHYYINDDIAQILHIDLATAMLCSDEVVTWR